jgi:hypothetical protein
MLIKITKAKYTDWKELRSYSELVNAANSPIQVEVSTTYKGDLADLPIILYGCVLSLSYTVNNECDAGQTKEVTYKINCIVNEKRDMRVKFYTDYHILDIITDSISMNFSYKYEDKIIRFPYRLDPFIDYSKLKGSFLRNFYFNCKDTFSNIIHTKTLDYEKYDHKKWNLFHLKDAQEYVSNLDKSKIKDIVFKLNCYTYDQGDQDYELVDSTNITEDIFYALRSKVNKDSNFTELYMQRLGFDNYRSLRHEDEDNYFVEVYIDLKE